MTNFPQTRHTLIQRIVALSSEDDWRQLLADYWRPVCRFAARWGKISIDDAEDVASTTFEVVIRNRLLERWTEDRRSKLRTLLCGIVRKILSNRSRSKKHRIAAVDSREIDLNTAMHSPDEAVDAFYIEWAMQQLQTATESLLQEYHRVGRGDYFRVLFGRICEQMSVSEVAHCLSLKTTDVENYFKHAKRNLTGRLEQMVREDVQRYTSHTDQSAEFRREWQQLGDFLKAQGGLEEAIRKSYESFDADDLKERETTSMTVILSHVGDFLAQSKQDKSSTE